MITEKNIPEIQFHYLIDECHQDTAVVLLSSVLAYLPDPYSLFDACLDKGVEYVIIDEIAFSRDDRVVITLQHVPEVIYKAVYPLHLFSYSNFKDFVSQKDYEILWDWDYRFCNSPTKTVFITKIPLRRVCC